MTKDGSLRWCFQRGTVMRRPDGTPFESRDWFERGDAWRSFAFLPLRTAQTFGVLGLASEDSERFYPGMGTVYLAERADVPIWAFHVLSLEGRTQGPVEWDTDRAQFLGRGRDPRRDLGKRSRQHSRVRHRDELARRRPERAHGSARPAGRRDVRENVGQSR